MSEINCNNCAVSDFKESLCHRCDEMKRLGRAEDIEGLLIKAFSEVDSPAKSSCIERQAAIDALKAHEDYKGYLHGDFEEILEALPSAQQGLSFEKIAALLANMFGDECACNFNDIDEWLPMSCKYSETACPHPDEPHGCWLQFLLHGGAEMRGEQE